MHVKKIIKEESVGCGDLLEGRGKAKVELEYSILWFWPLENDVLLM